MSSPLDDDFWEDLLTLIEGGKVIPVIGAGVITRGGDGQPVYPWLARRLAERLNVQTEALPKDFGLNSVATGHLLNHGEPNVLYTRLSRILRDECPPPGQALLDLASVTAFNLFLTTTFDPLMQQALDLVRYNGESRTSVYAFAPEAEGTDLPALRQDLPGSNVYHLLGKVSSIPDYAIWEEDMLEFIFALNKNMPKYLGWDLKKHGLLLLGLNFSDWPVRFFLRAAKQEQLSQLKVHRAYLADSGGESVSDSMVLFFGAVSRNIHVMREDPVAFCAELARRWRARHPESSHQIRRLSLAPKEMQRGAIFISYAREDEAAAATLVSGLEQFGCDVWYDRQRLQAGENWHNTLEDEVKKRCGLFLSMISTTTESTRESYYHQERHWAASRAERLSPGEEFYLPVVIDATSLQPAREPRIAHQSQAVRLLNGEVTELFAKRVLALQEKVLSARE